MIQKPMRMRHQKRERHPRRRPAVTVVICPKARPCLACGDLYVVNDGHKCGVKNEPLMAGTEGPERTRRNWVFNSPDNYRYTRTRPRLIRFRPQDETF